MRIATHSTGMLCNDRAVASHLARLWCIEKAIDALGGGLKRYGIYEDQLPADIQDAKVALWKAYHAEKKRQPNPMPETKEEE